jgi:hypothetical protein
MEVSKQEKRFALALSESGQEAVLKTEGAARQTKKKFIQFLHMAQGSLTELDKQIEIARRLG